LQPLTEQRNNHFEIDDGTQNFASQCCRHPIIKAINQIAIRLLFKKPAHFYIQQLHVVLTNDRNSNYLQTFSSNAAVGRQLSFQLDIKAAVLAKHFDYQVCMNITRMKKCWTKSPVSLVVDYVS
jgi:hypothetical protein